MDATTLTSHLRDDDEVEIVTVDDDDDDLVVTIWSVAVADAAYVRSVRAGAGKWYQRAVDRGRGGFVIDGESVPVSFARVDDETELDAVDDAYRGKYGDRYPDDTAAVLTPDTRACTLRVSAA